MPATASTRFWSRVEVLGPDECWLWRGYVQPSGYALFNRDKRQFRAHRFAYMDAVGPIPEGLVLDHLCRVRHCVNPGHLEAVTSAENILRGEGITARCARKTCCVRGHEYTPENTYTRPKGRECKTCARERQRLDWVAV